MGRAGFGPDAAPGVLVDTDPVVDPVAAAWARLLAAPSRRGSTVPAFADAVASLLARELDAHHVALWRRDGDDYVVLGAAGMTEAARRMRLSRRYPVVQVARGSGGTLVRGRDHQGPRAPGLPGSGSPAYAMLLLDLEPGAVMVDVVTISGPDVDEATVTRVRDLLAVELRDAWPPWIVTD